MVVSDGDQLKGDAVEAARKAYQQGIRIHTAENKPLDEAIDLLRDSTDHLQRGVSLEPADASLRADYEKARQAFQQRLQAHAEPFEQSLAQAQERVEQKLSQLLTRRGQREQKQGNEQADEKLDQAWEKRLKSVDAGSGVP